MDKTKLISAVVVILLLGGYLTYSFVNNTENKNVSVNGDSSNNMGAEEKMEVQKNEDGPVSVSVQPLMSSFDTNSSWEFEVILNTHSVDLDYDMRDFVVLTDKAGNEYKPSKWTGDPLGGHHREGVLTFDAVELKSSDITMLVRDIGGVPEREFVWIATP